MSDSFITAITNEAMSRICYTGGWVLTPFKFYISEEDIFGGYNGIIPDSGDVPQEALEYLKRKTTEDFESDIDAGNVWYNNKFSGISKAADNTLTHHITIPGDDVNIDGNSKDIKTIYFIYKDNNGYEFLYAIASCRGNTVYEKGVTQSFFFTFTVSNDDAKDLVSFNLEYSAAHEISDHNSEQNDGVHSFLLARDGSRKAVDFLYYEDDITVTSFNELGNPKNGQKLASKAYVDWVANGAAGDTSDLVYQVCPPGSMMWWPSTKIPTGWAIRDGQSLSKASYPKLYAALKGNNSTCIYGETSTTFNLPDDRGLYIRGSETAGNGSSSVSNGNKLSGISFGAIQQSAAPNIKGKMNGHDQGKGGLNGPFQGYYAGSGGRDKHEYSYSYYGYDFDANRCWSGYTNGLTEVRTINRNYIPIIKLDY